jgi:hypothetical protein
MNPTVGRKVWYIPSDQDLAGNFGMQCAPQQPLDATVIGVWSDVCVNLQVIDLKGHVFTVESADLIQPDTIAPKMEGRAKGYAIWMPYQISLQTKANAVADTASSAATPAPHVKREEIDNLTNRVIQHMSDGSVKYRSAVGVKQSDLIGN